METIKCAKCGCVMSTISEACPLCGTPTYKDSSNDEKNDFVLEAAQLSEVLDVEAKTELDYEIYDMRTTIDIPDCVSYYDDILSHLEEFIAIQNTKPKNEVTLLLALDLFKIDLIDDESMTDDDPRLGINSFGISNVIFSKYNNWEPLFKDKVSSGRPQIFVSIMDWQADLDKILKFAKEHCISHALERGWDRYNQEYSKLILSFDDDTIAATKFLCNVSTNILSVPGNVPITINISSYQTKAKAQKEYKRNNTFGAKAFAKGAMLLLKDKISGK